MSYFAAGAAVVSAGVGIAGQMGAFGGGGSLPSYGYDFQPVAPVQYNPQAGAQDLNSMLGDLTKFANASTANQTKQREKIMPGSKAQFGQASKVLQSWMKGEVPQDVVNASNRIIAQRTGGTFNPYTGGGHSQEAFARSIGQLSSQFTEKGISAAPAWQQLANSFVTSIPQVAGLALQAGQNRYQYDALNANIGMYNGTQGMANAQNQYMSGVNSTQYDQMRANQMTSSIQSGIGGAAQAYGSAYPAMNQPQNFQPQYQGQYNDMPVYSPGAYRTPGANGSYSQWMSTNDAPFRKY